MSWRTRWHYGGAKCQIKRHGAPGSGSLASIREECSVMKVPQVRQPRAVAATVGILALVGAAAAVPAAVGATSSAKPNMAPHVVLASGLDNPRQLQRLTGGDLLIAEAGHGGNNPDNCFGSGGDAQCIGITSKITRYRNGHL